MSTILVMHDGSYSEYTFANGRWHYRRTVDLMRDVCLL